MVTLNKKEDVDLKRLSRENIIVVKKFSENESEKL
jgi:hypothetical protein